MDQIMFEPASKKKLIVTKGTVVVIKIYVFVCSFIHYLLSKASQECYV